jgi:hypothetical protein
VPLSLWANAAGISRSKQRKAQTVKRIELLLVKDGTEQKSWNSPLSQYFCVAKVFLLYLLGTRRNPHRNRKIPMYGHMVADSLNEWIVFEKKTHEKGKRRSAGQHFSFSTSRGFLKFLGR